MNPEIQVRTLAAQQAAEVERSTEVRNAVQTESGQEAARYQGESEKLLGHFHISITHLRGHLGSDRLSLCRGRDQPSANHAPGVAHRVADSPQRLEEVLAEQFFVQNVDADVQPQVVGRETTTEETFAETAEEATATVTTQTETTQSEATNVHDRTNAEYSNTELSPLGLHVYLLTNKRHPRHAACSVLS